MIADEQHIKQLPASGALSGHVDKNFYLRLYPDVDGSGMDAAFHYHKHGWREGRNPSPGFITAFYALKHLPGGKLTEDPLLHYIKQGGEASGLVTSPDTMIAWVDEQKQLVRPHFDEKFYRQKYGEQLGNLHPLDHYFAVGWRTGCNPSKHFETKPYVDAHAFIVQSDLNPFFHYILLMAESAEARPDDAKPTTTWSIALARADMLRAIGEHFDPAYYKAKYPDVAQAGKNPLVHFVDYGWREGRDPSATFCTSYYLSRYGNEIGVDVNPLYHYAVHGRALGYRANAVGTKTWPRPVAPSMPEWDRAIAAKDKRADINVIIPVYRGSDDTLATIFSVLTNPQRTKFQLTVINDSSPDPLLTVTLRELARKRLFAYSENPRNLGFIGTINKGLTFLPNRDAILLNADTLVFGDWIDRLLAHANRDATIGTITPFSNNATICSYPDTNAKNSLALECTLAQLDSYAAKCNNGRSTCIPTGVGFCMYVRRALIDKIGGLDPEFGRGYGEENDLCMRALKAGYKNILAEDVLVFHSGSVSFAEFFEEEYTSGQKLLAGKHPDYARRISAFVRADPGIKSRGRLDMYRLARRLGKRTALFVTMDGSGGIVTHVVAMARRLAEQNIHVLIANLSGDTVHFRPFDHTHEIYTPSLKPIDLTFERDLFEEFINWMEPELLHLHSVALASWSATRCVFETLRRFGDRLYVTLHDYDPLCYRHNMVDAEGRYCATHDMAKCNACVRLGNAANRCAPEARLADWHALLQAARRVFVPSDDTRRRMQGVFADIDFRVREHEENFQNIPTIPAPSTKEPLRLVAIGAIGPHKGSDLIYSLALDARIRELPIEYHVVGYTSIDAEMKKVGVTVTGRYSDNDDALASIAEIRPTYALFLSIWPETYCYALSIALALGLPPVVFAIGAQAERVRKAGFGLTLDPALADDPKAFNDAILQLDAGDEWAKVKPVQFFHYDQFPTDYYELGSGLMTNS